MLKSKAIKNEYSAELLKQTKPYDYFCTYLDAELEERISPLSCDDVPGGRVYEYEDYFVFEEENGYSSDEERAYLVEYARKLNADYTYSDVDFVDENDEKQAVFFKPEFDWDTYDSFDYISDFFAVKKTLNNMSLNSSNTIAHVTKVLYHSYYGNGENTRPAIELINEKYNGRLITPDYYADESITDEMISVIIPSKDNPDRLESCLHGIQNAKIKSGFNILSVYIIDNGSTPKNKEKITEIIEKYDEQEGLIIRYTYEPDEFNFSKMCNMGAKESSGSYLLFMNDDIDITDDDFLVKLLYYARKPHVGAVGCKLLYPAGKRIQHVGITNLKYAGPSHKLSTFEDKGSIYFGRNLGVHNCIAVTGACLMVSSEKFFKTGGFCDKMKVGYNDVDLCVSLYEYGYHNIVNNDLCLIHHESVTRGADAGSTERLARLKSERDLLYKRHPFLMKGSDPYYNPNLAGDFLDYRVNVIPDYLNRTFRSARIDLLASKKRNPADDPALSVDRLKSPEDLFATIESYDIKTDAMTMTRYFEITGWALLNKKDNAFYDTYLYLSVKLDQNASLGDEQDDNMSRAVPVGTFTTAPVYREDLQEVFPKAKNVELSGFLVRIDLDRLKNVLDLRNLCFDVILQNKKTGKLLYGQCEQPNI